VSAASTSENALVDRYDGVLLDLDGTAFRGAVPTPGAVRSLAEVRARGRAICFITNNASRSPAQVAQHLTQLGFTADAAHVVTSAQAGASLLTEHLQAGDTVLVVGTEALADEVRGVGLAAVRRFDQRPVAVVQGHSPDTGWADLAQACLAIRAGALWVACNVDPTLPTEIGELPGNGAMVAALRAATGCEPLVAGKPQRRLMDLGGARLQLRYPLVVGDRLDTDIAGARAAGMDALLVLSGVATPAALLAAPPQQRPRYVAADLISLLQPAATAEIGEQPDWRVQHSTGSATLSYRGADGSAAQPLAALRALCAALWLEEAGEAPIKPSDDAARTALEKLRLG
jgi:glycerol 3-phosphatase-2